jgi:hypothetical protein
LYRAYQEFLDEETLQDIHLEEGQNIIIFGDIHGQFPDFIKVIEKEGLPSEKLKYVKYENKSLKILTISFF